MASSTPGPGTGHHVPGVVVLDAGGSRSRRTPPPRASGSGIWRLARRLTGLGRRTTAVSLAAAAPVVEQLSREALRRAVPVAQQVAGPLGPVVGPVVGPVLGPVVDRIPHQLAAPLTGPLARLAGPATGRTFRGSLAVRHAGRDLPLDPDGLAAAYPAATGRLLVLVPGAGEDEQVWHTGAETTGATYGDRLAGLLGWTPVTLRHDAGAELAGAGLELSATLQRLVDAWPVPVERIVLLAHGTGGLVARGALGVRAAGPDARTDAWTDAWTDAVTELVALGTPHLAVDRVPLTRGVGRAIDEALAGIVVVGQEVVDVPPLEGVDYLLVLPRTSVHGDPVGRALGDLLWWRHRLPRGQRVVHDLFPTAERFEVSTRVQPLVNHTEVHDALLHWLA